MVLRVAELPMSSVVQLYVSASPSGSTLVVAEAVATIGAAPCVASSVMAGNGGRLPAPTYSIRARPASGLPVNQDIPYSNTYSVPSGEKRAAIGKVY